MTKEDGESERGETQVLEGLRAYLYKSTSKLREGPLGVGSWQGATMRIWMASEYDPERHDYWLNQDWYAFQTIAGGAITENDARSLLNKLATYREDLFGKLIDRVTELLMAQRFQYWVRKLGKLESNEYHFDETGRGQLIEVLNEMARVGRVDAADLAQLFVRLTSRYVDHATEEYLGKMLK